MIFFKLSMQLGNFELISKNLDNKSKVVVIIANLSSKLTDLVNRSVSSCLWCLYYLLLWEYYQLSLIQSELELLKKRAKDIEKCFGIPNFQNRSGETLILVQSGGKYDSTRIPPTYLKAESHFFSFYLAAALSHFRVTKFPSKKAKKKKDLVTNRKKEYSHTTTPKWW